MRPSWVFLLLDVLLFLFYPVLYVANKIRRVIQLRRQ